MFATLSFDSTKAKAKVNTQNAVIVSAPRPRRQQVARACNNCRAYRIKCDSGQPCRNCERKGKKCDHENSNEFRTFANAVREIERLNKRVEELEALLQRNSSTIRPRLESVVPGEFSEAVTSLPTNLDPLVEHGGNKNYWECIQLDTRMGTTQCYGPASVFYFIARMNLHLTDSPRDPSNSKQVVAIAERLSLVSNTDFESNFMHMAGPINRIYMERAYEEFYLTIFWEEYHCLYPIIEEADFWNYHRSLWDRSQKFRKPSALVDIILAICLQHGTTACRAGGRPNALADKSDEIIASRWFYRRCQSLLTNQLETPSVMTLQSHMLSVVYLSNANSQNAAHSVLAIAIRTGIILGLHLEPPDHLPEQQREARKRLWWLLYALEMKFAMELGRPLAVNISQVTCSLPSDEILIYSNVQQKTVQSQEAAFLSFAVHFVRLILATRSIYITFYDNCAGVLGRAKQRSIYETPAALEDCAQYLEAKMQYVLKWRKDVPKALRAGKGDDWATLSADESQVLPDPTLPRWQQQQSIVLELHFHNMIMSLHRPFICFPPPAGFAASHAHRGAQCCLSHARTMTLIIYRTLVHTKLLENHHEAFRWQWNATLAMIGYVIAYPAATETAMTIDTVHTAIKVFERLGETFAIAHVAQQTTEELLASVCAANEAPRLGSFTAGPLQLDPQTVAPSEAQEPLQLIEPAHISGHDSFVAANGMASVADVSDRFAWGQNLICDDLFGMGKVTGSFPSMTWPGTHASEDDELFRLLNTAEYGADGATAMLDALSHT